MLMECQSCRFILLADPRVAAMVLSTSGLRVPASIRTRHMYGTPTTRQSDCELQFSREFRLVSYWFGAPRFGSWPYTHILSLQIPS
jgi:hypothetical protein